jgi:hypothetical protein
LNTFKSDELFVRGSPESIVFSHLTKESNHYHSSVLVFFWQVYLITENNKPLVELLWSQNDSLLSFLVFTVLVESLKDEFWLGTAREVDKDHFQVWHHLESGH